MKLDWKLSIMAFFLALISGFSLSPFMNVLGGNILLLSTFAELLLLAIALLIGRSSFSWRDLLSEIGFRKPSGTWIVISTIGMTGVWFVVIFMSGVISYFFPYPPAYEEAVSSLFLQRSLLDSVLWTVQIFLFIGPCEEILFRGIMQRGFENSSGEFLAILITSILFAAIHMDLRGMIPRVFLGIVLGFMYTRSKHNIVVPSIAHGVYDFIGIVLLQTLL